MASEPARPVVVAMGASAGGLEALRSFFEKMPAGSGMAFVVAMHLDPTHKSAMPALLSRITPMEVVEVEGPQRLLPNHVYMAHPATQLRVRHGRLEVDPAPTKRQLPAAVDVLFESVAADCAGRCAAVVMSGMGHDGAAGVAAIKAAGGLVVVQSPQTAQATSMPESAIANDHPDAVIAPEEMPAFLLSHIRSGPSKAPVRPADSAMEAIQRELHAKTGYDFSRYKCGTIQRRVQRRMTLRHLATLSEYAALLGRDPAETRALFHDVLVGVTEFFRDPDSWVSLRDLVIDPLIRSAPTGSTIRVWVPGCASGQEAYSIAILLTERMEALSRPLEARIFATDINDAALDVARAGVFGEEALDGIDQKRRTRFFSRTPDGKHQIGKQVRSMVIFAQQSLIADPPFSKLDLISCRNVLIYLGTDVQRKVIDVFCHALRPGGYLMLGNTESPGGTEEWLRPVSKKWRLYQRTARSRRPSVQFLLEKIDHTRPGLLAALPREGAPSRLAALAQRAIAEQFAFASALVDQDGRVLYFGGPTADFLTQPTGAPTQDIVELAAPALRGKLRAGLKEAQSSHRPVFLRNIHFGRGRKTQSVSMRIMPITDTGDSTALLLVVFEDGSQKGARRGLRNVAAEHDSLVRRLEHDLRITRDDLQAHVEELEASNEKLKAANEEMLSMNEELQSSNEELETSKEELQSLNEELTTVNNQLHSKVEEIEATNNDLENLLASTDLATLFLDRDFRIRRFTPAIRRLVSLVPTDIGRSITDFAHRFSDPGLLGDAQAVLTNLRAAEKEVLSVDGACYLRRILPYRTEDGRIDGVVVTFTDITERRAAEAGKARLAAIVESSDDAILSVNRDETIASWNQAAQRMYGYTAHEAIGKPVSLIVPEDRRAESSELMDRARMGEATNHLETVRLAKEGRLVPVSLTVSPLLDAAGDVIGASKIARDISDRKDAEARQLLLLAELDHRVKNSLAVVASLCSQTLAESDSLEDFGLAFEGRLMALAQAHRLLSRSKWQGGALRDIIRTAVAAMDEAERVVLDGDDINLPPRVAISLSMVFHELATNAAKYGSLSSPKGHLRVRWTLGQSDGDHTLECEWTETDGPRVQPAAEQGFGTRLIQACAEKELRGRAEMEFDTHGLICRLWGRWPTVEANEFQPQDTR